jgi:hypothetical protein
MVVSVPLTGLAVEEPLLGVGFAAGVVLLELQAARRVAAAIAATVSRGAVLRVRWCRGLRTVMGPPGRRRGLPYAEENRSDVCVVSMG